MENIRRQEQELKNMTQFLYRFHPIREFNNSYSMLHFLVDWYHRSLTFWRTWKPKSKAQTKRISLQIVTDQQKREILNSSWKYLINAPVTVFESKQKFWQIFLKKVQQLSKFRRTQLTENLFERCCINQPVLRINSGGYDISFILSCLLTVLVIERLHERVAMKNANQFAYFKNGSVQLPSTLNLPQLATNVNSLL